MPLVAALGVALVSGFLTTPLTPLPVLVPDAIEYLTIAHVWVHGAGFVDPVQWHYALPGTAPAPAFAIRPPAVPVLAAIPFALGARMETVFALCAVWASVISGGVVLVAARFMRPPAAAAAALLLVLSPGWLALAQLPSTEVTGLAAYVTVLATARRVPQSVRGALLCAVATICAWLTRPNLGALVLAVSAAAVWELGPRRSVRHAPIWAYLVGFAVFYAFIHLSVIAATGVAPYAGFAVVGEALDRGDVWKYDKGYVGAWSFAAAHSDRILNIMGRRALALYKCLCLRPMFHYVGWLIPPAVLYALWRRRDGTVEHRINAFSLLGFSLIFIMNYAYAVGTCRHAFFSAVGAVFCGVSMLDEATLALERHLRTRRAVRTASLARALPLVAVVCLFVATTAGKTVPSSLTAWRYYNQRREAADRIAEIAPLVSIPFCARMDKDAIVAAPDPWAVAWACGNAALVLPWDLASNTVRDRFLTERHPGYLIQPTRRPAFEWMRHSPRLREVADSGSLRLFEVRDPDPRSRPWSAPPPLACAGAGPDCARRLGR